MSLYDSLGLIELSPVPAGSDGWESDAGLIFVWDYFDPVKASLSQNYGSLSVVASARLGIQAAVNSSYGSLSVSASASLKIQGALAASYGGLTASAVGRLLLRGAADISYGDLSAFGRGTLGVTASFAGSYGFLSLQAAATLAGGPEPETVDVPGPVAFIFLSATQSPVVAYAATPGPLRVAAVAVTVGQPAPVVTKIEVKP